VPLYICLSFDPHLHSFLAWYFDFIFVFIGLKGFSAKNTVCIKDYNLIPLRLYPEGSRIFPDILTPIYEAT
jgi:hypothetical protein